MPTITFESLGGEDTEALGATGYGEILLFGTGISSFAAGAYGYGEILLYQGPQLAAPPAIASSGYGEIELLQVEGFIPLVIPGEGDGLIELFGQGYWTPNYGLGVIELFGEGFSVPPPPVFLEDSMYIGESLEFGYDLSGQDTAVIRALIAFGVDPQTAIDSSVDVREELLLGVALDAVYLILVTESLGLADLPEATPDRLERVVEHLLLAGLVNSEAEALTAVIESLTMAAVEDAMNRVTVVEELDLNGLTEQTFQAMSAVVEELMIDVTMNDTATATIIVTENVTFNVTMSSEAEAFEYIRENLGFVIRLNLDGFNYIGWSYGTGNAQLSRYTNFPFNSFAELDGKWIGATTEGLFEIGGGDDDGDPIAVKLRGAMTDLGDSQMKRVGYAYLYYSAPDGLILRTITTSEDGEKIAHAYKLNPQPSSATREGRIKLGQGVKSVEWGWELENIDGGSVSLDGLEFVTIQMQRKMRGKNT